MRPFDRRAAAPSTTSSGAIAQEPASGTDATVRARVLERGSARQERTAWLRALAWLLLALAGQVAALQLMIPGRRIGYQHYLAIRDLLSAQALPWMLLIVAQAVLVVIGGRRLWPVAWRWLRARSKPLGIAAIGLAFIATSSVLERDPFEFAAHLVFATVVQLLGLGAIVLAAARLDGGSARALGAGIERWLGPRAEGAASGRLDGFACAAAAWVVIVAALIGFVSYEWHPHVPDELVYLIHARYFAEGMLAMPAPPVPEAFALDLTTVEPDRWYSPVPPGWPALLALGVRLGIPWLVNPLLAGFSVLMAYALIRRIYDVRVARCAVLLLCASPWFLFMSMNLMTHAMTLAVALAAALATERLVRTGRRAWALPAGACAGILVFIRPLEALIVAALMGTWVLVAARGSLRVTGVLAMAFASIAVAALALPYNAYFTGDPATFPIMAYTNAMYGPGTNALGFGSNRGLGWSGLDPFPGHGAIDVAINTALNATLINTELLGWSAGSLLPILALLLLGRLRRADGWMIAVIAMTVGVHAFYWFSGGPDFGARYWYLVLVPCMVLAARGILELADRLASERTREAGARVMFAALAFVLLALVAFVPWRATDKYYHYREMRPDVRRLADRHDFGTSLVLIRGRSFPDFASAAAYNPIDLNAPAPVYAWDSNPMVRRAVLQAFADRPVWIVAGPTATGNGFQVERGPIAAELLLQEMEAGAGSGGGGWR